MITTTKNQEQQYSEKLKKLGFTDNDSKVFIVLLKGDLMSASDIAKEAGIRRTDIYDILKRFVQKGFCNEIDTNKILMYQMIDPQVISDKIVNDINQQSKNQISDTLNLFENLQPLFRSNKIDDPTKINIELVRGFNRHRDVKFLNMIENSKDEILNMTRMEGIVSDEFNKASEKFIKKGGVIKSVFELNSNFKIEKDGKVINAKKDDLINICKKFEKNGEKVRLTEDTITNFTIFDRKIAYIHIFDKELPRHNRSDIFIKNPEFANYMANVFELQWDNSKELNKI